MSSSLPSSKEMAEMRVGELATIFSEESDPPQRFIVNDSWADVKGDCTGEILNREDTIAFRLVQPDGVGMNIPARGDLTIEEISAHGWYRVHSIGSIKDGIGSPFLTIEEIKKALLNASFIDVKAP
jgi:hypothetical protein